MRKEEYHVINVYIKRKKTLKGKVPFEKPKSEKSRFQGKIRKREMWQQVSNGDTHLTEGLLSQRPEDYIRKKVVPMIALFVLHRQFGPVVQTPAKASCNQHSP